MKKVLLIAVVLLLIVIAAVWIAGASLSRDHVATSRARYGHPPEEVWEVITDFEGTPRWWSGVQSAERGGEWKGAPVWVLASGFGPLPLAVIEADPPRRMVTEIASDDLPFGGTWTWQVEPVDGGATLAITERGSVKNPFFRFLSRFVTGYHGTMDSLLRDLGAKLGERVAPVHLPDQSDSRGAEAE